VIILVSGTDLANASAAGAPFHAVTFLENDNTLDQVFSSLTANSTTDLTQFANLNPTFTDPGLTFVDWNTSPDGSGTSYADGAPYDFNSPLQLYAIWAGSFHAVTFVENANATDNTESSETDNSTTDLTGFSDLSPIFSNPGYTFVDWNTASDGSGTSFADGAPYSFKVPMQLFAIWKASSATAIFDPNGGAGTILPLAISTGASTALPSGGAFTRVGYAFNDWNTAANGSGVSYAPGSFLATQSNVTLFAQWTLVIVDVIAFRANGSSGSQVSLQGDGGSQVKLPGQSGFIKPGFHLVRWNTKGNGKGISFAIGQTVTLSDSLTLFAQWTGHSPPVLISAIGTFSKGSSKISKTLNRQVERVASAVRVHHYRLVTLFGYSASTGLVSFDASLSRSRAAAVARLLRSDLHHIHVGGVRIAAAGEGSIPGESTPTFSRVEVFVS
jgi:uncharacterized repeat protein (TIGR02543 family)